MSDQGHPVPRVVRSNPDAETPCRQQAKRFAAPSSYGHGLNRVAGSAARSARLAANHRRDETVDALVVAGKCGRARSLTARARVAGGSRDRRSRSDADLRRARCGRALHSLPVAAVDGDAGPHAARGDAIEDGRGHGYGNRVAVRRPVGRRRHGGEIDRVQDLDARRRRAFGRAGQAAADAARPRYR